MYVRAGNAHTERDMFEKLILDTNGIKVTLTLGIKKLIIGAVHAFLGDMFCLEV